MKQSLKQKIYLKIPENKRDGVSKTYRVFRIIKNVICWTLLALLVVMVVVFLMMRMRGELPSLFGYSIQRVQTGSMVPELQVGDLLLSKKVDDTSDIKVGDIITFQGGSFFDNNLVTHRVIVAPHTDESGKLVLQTKGDANDTEDPVIEASSVETKLVTKLTFLNGLYNVFLSPWGLILFILLLVFVFFDEVLNIGRIVSGNYDDEDEEDINDIIARIQREDKEKALAEKKPEDENAD